MNIIEKSAGAKIGYSLTDKKLTIGGALMLALDRYQKDWPIHIDVMADADGNLLLGSGRFYVAEVDIPAREYDETEADNPNPSPSGESDGKTIVRTPKDLDTEKVTLTLWSIDGLNLPAEE